MSKSKFVFLPLLMVTVLLIQMMSPISALADGETPPEPSESTEQVTPPDEPVEGTAGGETAGAPAEEALPADEAAGRRKPESDKATPKSEAPPAPPAQRASAGDPDDLNVGEALGQIRVETEVMVLDGGGEIEPLATEEAAEIVVAADPIWCPDGITPKDGLGGCSPSYTTLTDLVSWLQANDPDQAGTIWIEKTYDSEAEGVDGFILSGYDFANFDTHALTIQGGWQGLGSTSVASSDPSTFTGDYLLIVDWNAPVTVKDILVDGSNRIGLQVVTHDSDIILANVTSINNDRYGAYLLTDASGGISLNQENTFSDNQYYGLYAYTEDGDISAHNLSASNNGNDDVYYYYGFGQGAVLSTERGDITLTGDNTFNGNGYFGLEAYTSSGNITINNLTANDNRPGQVYYFYGGYGADLLAGGEGGITLTGDNTFNNNGYVGLSATTGGSIAINNLEASFNGTENGYYYGGYGAYLYNPYGSNNKEVTLTGTNTFEGNPSYGLLIYSSGNISVSNLNVSGSEYYGAYFDNSSVTKDITIQIGDIHDNGTGLWSSQNGTLTLNCVHFVDNTQDLQQNGGTLVAYCIVSNPGQDKEDKGTKPVLVVEAGVDAVELNCDLYSGTRLVLPSGDSATFPCPIRETAQLTGNTGGEKDLPGDLPEGTTFQSAFTIAVNEDDGTRENLSTYTTLSFVIPEGVDVDSLAILYWDGEAWVELSDGLILEDGKVVGQAGFLSADGTSFQATVTFTGIFVLVSK